MEEQSLLDVVMALATLLTCRQECGMSGSNKDPVPGEHHPLTLKEGHEPLISVLGSIDRVLTVCTHDVTNC